MSSVLTSNFLPPGEGYAPPQSGALSMGDMGQYGYAPDERTLLSSQMYIQRPLTLVLLAAPKIITLTDQPDEFYKAFKNFIETLPVKVEGFHAGLKPEFDEVDVGFAGEKLQSLTDMKRVRTEPVFNYHERKGRPIQNFIGWWMMFGMADPETKIPLAMTLPAYRDAIMTAGGWGAEWYTCSYMAYETDSSGLKVDKCWITTNSMPMDQGDVDGVRDMTSAASKLELSIPMTGFSTYNDATIAYAQAYLDNISYDNADPRRRPAWIIGAEDPSVAGAATGYKFGIDDLAARQI